MGLFDFLKGKGGGQKDYGDDAFAMYGITDASPIDGQPIEPAEQAGATDGFGGAGGGDGGQTGA